MQVLIIQEKKSTWLLNRHLLTPNDVSAHTEHYTHEQVRT